MIEGTLRQETMAILGEIMMKHLYKICAFFLLSFGSSESKLNTNELTKVFYHQGRSVQGKESKEMCASNIELGKVVFYFSKTQIINALQAPQKKDNIVEQEFFIPLTDIKSAECVQMVQNLNSAANKVDEKHWYSVHLETVKVPVKGIKLTIAYNADRVHVGMEEFQAITGQKGFAISFFNQQLLQEIKNRGKGILRTAQAAHKSVIIDCGHGGGDCGTCGFFNLKEKDVTLDIGLHVAHLLRKKGVEVFLTRSADVEVPLDVRTTFANGCKQPGAFVSIHANNGTKDAQGIETFCLTPQLFKKYGTRFESQDVAECATNGLYKQSQTLAQLVHDTTVAYAQKKQPTVDRLIKNSVAQVLFGTHMPSALIEVGFLSNEQEASLLKDSTYRQLLAQGICKGILSYFEKVTA